MHKIGMSSIGFEHTDENFQKLRSSGLEAIEVALSSGEPLMLTFDDFYENAKTIFSGIQPKKWY